VRVYDYKCRSCGAEHAEPADVDPGPLYVCACRHLTRYWRSRPEIAFVKPDTTGMAFGPTAAELADTGRPHARVRDNAADMGAFRDELPKMPEHVQGKLF
jgi:hypothetical protein